MMGAMTAYLIVNYSVDDADSYKQYQKGGRSGPRSIGSDCKVLVLDSGLGAASKGEGAGHQTVVLEFESKENAKEIYESGAYQEVLPLRLGGATSRHFCPDRRRLLDAVVTDTRPPSTGSPTRPSSSSRPSSATSA